MIPNDPCMLLSFVNTQLRDKNINLKEFCIEYDENEENIKDKLKSIDYIYSEEENKFL